MSIDKTHRECANLHVGYFLNKLTDWSYDRETILIEILKVLQFFKMLTVVKKPVVEKIEKTSRRMEEEKVQVTKGIII